MTSEAIVQSQFRGRSSLGADTQALCRSSGGAAEIPEHPLCIHKSIHAVERAVCIFLCRRFHRFKRVAREYEYIGISTLVVVWVLARLPAPLCTVGMWNKHR